MGEDLNTPSQLDSSLVSVVIPVYNATRTLGETLDSLYAQTHTQLEILVVDDASQDDLKTVLQQHQDPRLRLISLPRNMGVSAARNRGIRMATGGFIAFCDADDLCVPHRIQTQLEYFRAHPEIGLCGSSFTPFSAVASEAICHPSHDAEIRRALMQGNSFGLSTVMVRMAALGDMLLFDESLRLAEDYALWTRLAGAGVKLANIEESLVMYRLHSGQASECGGEQLDNTSARLRSLYCASILQSQRLQDAICASRFGMDVLKHGANEVLKCIRDPAVGLTSTDFRFLLAHLFAGIESPTIAQWWEWCRIQRNLGLDLDGNYRFNVLLLALLPESLQARHHGQLSKLKR